MFPRIAFNGVQVLVVMSFAPLVSGVLGRLKEMVQSKRDPSVFQPYRDLWKFFHKDEVIAEDSSWLFRFTPYIVFPTPIFVALLIPVLTSYPLFFAFMGDMLSGGFVLALGGFFATLAAVDFAGIAISRDLPLLVELAIATDGLIIVFIMGVLTRAVHKHVGTTEVGSLANLKEGGIW